MAGVDVGTAYLTIVPSAKGFAGKLQGELGGGMAAAGSKAGDTAAKGFGGRFKSGIATAAKAGALGLAAALAVGIGFAKAAVGEAREAQKVGALTTNVIKSTGGAAKITAAQVGDLATAISLKTGIDDEAIQSGANLLLTFKNVKNEVGDGANIFDRATQAATDLSASGFGDLSATSKQLGKALNDPVKGISALSRSGVTFTEQQKKQIKTLVASNKTLEAQKIILGEVESQVGGAAAATATMGEKAATSFGNLKEQIGTALLPVIDKIETALVNKVIPAVSKFFTEMQNGTGKGGEFVTFLKSVGSTAQRIGGFITGTLVPALAVFFSFLNGNDTGVDGPFRRMAVAGTELRAVLIGTGSALVAVAGFLQRNSDVVVPLVVALVSAVAVIKTIAAVSKAYTAVQLALNVALTANPIGIVIVAIALLVAGLVIAYKKSETFRNIVNRQFDLIKIGALTLAKVAIQAFQFLNNAFLTMVEVLLKGAVKAFGWVPGLGPKLKTAAANVSKFKDESNSALDKIKNELNIKIDTAVATAKLNELRRIAGRPVTVPVFLKTTYTAGRVNVAGIGAVNAGQRASGGPVSGGSPYWVGENPDGSLNKTSELFVPKTSGTIYNQKQLAGAGGSQAGLVQALTTALERANLSASISAGSVDMALAGGYRG